MAASAIKAVMESEIKFYMKPFVKFYLKKQQDQFVKDLKEALKP